MARRPSALLCLACIALSAMASDAPTGLLDDVAFSYVDATSSSAQLLHRLVTPLNAQRLTRQASTGIVEQPADPTKEHFALYVPSKAPPDGYALLVFVPPWNEARVPAEWTSILEKRGVILVTAAGIGNDANLLDRRDPVALLAASNVMARYPVNRKAVYVGGFSGGSRVALRLALGYPDVFHGVLLDAGSDVLGEDLPVPPRELMTQFQSSTRVVYLTGQLDAARQDRDRLSRRALHQWCVEDVDTRSMPSAGHDLADAASFDRALPSLEDHHAPDASTLAACQARIERDMAKALDAVQAAIDAGHREDAQRQLDAVDRNYGGWAAPRSITLAAQLESAPSR